MFTVTVTAEQLETIRGYLPDVAAAAKPYRAPAKRATTRRPAIKWQSPGLPPLKPMKVSEQDAAERDWNAECARARVLVAEGKPSEAELTLRELIALHYPESVAK